MSLNNLLASPSFASWLEGEPLDIGRMLYTPEGKPRLAIISIAHLDDAQRMFFVTMLLNEMLAWIRTQPGTSSLRAILYMDEVFGYFPPLAQPAGEAADAHAAEAGPRVRPGLRAGDAEPGRPRLQRPVERRHVVPRPAANRARQGPRDRRAWKARRRRPGRRSIASKMEATLAALGNRVFLMNNVHDDAPVVFQTRWAMSYLCGPLTREQIKTLMDPVRANFAASSVSQANGGKKTDGDNAVANVAAIQRQAVRIGPFWPPAFMRSSRRSTNGVPDGFQLQYRPALLGRGKVHFVRKGEGVDVWRECCLVATES